MFKESEEHKIITCLISHHTGNRKIIFLKDDAGNVQLLNPNDVQLIKDLEKKFEVVEEGKNE